MYTKIISWSIWSIHKKVFKNSKKRRRKNYCKWVESLPKKEISSMFKVPPGSDVALPFCRVATVYTRCSMHQREGSANAADWVDSATGPFSTAPLFFSFEERLNCGPHPLILSSPASAPQPCLLAPTSSPARLHSAHSVSKPLNQSRRLPTNTLSLSL